MHGFGKHFFDCDWSFDGDEKIDDGVDWTTTEELFERNEDCDGVVNVLENAELLAEDSFANSSCTFDENEFGFVKILVE